VPSVIQSRSFLVEVVTDRAFVIEGYHGAGHDRLEEAAAAFFFFVGDVARDCFDLLIGCRNSSTPFAFSCNKNNFPLILTPPESLLRELTVLWRLGWRSGGMAPWWRRKT
jgi:hypothetical protein